jgi:hypothetical protein
MFALLSMSHKLLTAQVRTMGERQDFTIILSNPSQDPEAFRWTSMGGGTF